MSKILVSIVGAQTLPNILPIKEFGNTIDKYIFISTTKVKKELEWIIRVCDLETSKINNIEVDEDDIGQINEKLFDATSNLDTPGEFSVNLTGGTKIMALGTFQFFAGSSFNSKMFYLTMGSNILRQVYPSVDKSQRDTDLKYRLNVEEFMGAYGTAITNKQSIYTMCQSKDYTTKFFEKKWSKDEIMHELRKEKYGVIFERIDSTYKESIQNFLRKISFPVQSEDRLTRVEIQYLTGGWWEEFCFHFIKERFGLREPFIAKGLINTKTNNELDVVFVKENVLHVLECKTTILEKLQFEDYLYKLAAIKSNQDGFGNGVKAYLFTNLIKRDLKTNKIDDTIQKRADAFDVKLVDKVVFKKSDFTL